MVKIRGGEGEKARRRDREGKKRGRKTEIGTR
jgi:hypothetical protein